MAEIKTNCAACGVEFIYTRGGRRKYCDACKALPEGRRSAMVRARDEAQRSERDRLEALRRKQDPFNPALMSDKRLGAVIKLFKMTYGTYTAAYRSGMLIPILKAKGFKNPKKMLEKMEEK